MLVRHSPAAIVHQLAVEEAKSSLTRLALVARLRAQMALEVAAETPQAPGNEIEAAEHLLDKTA